MGIGVPVRPCSTSQRAGCGMHRPPDACAPTIMAPTSKPRDPTDQELAEMHAIFPGSPCEECELPITRTDLLNGRGVTIMDDADHPEEVHAYHDYCHRDMVRRFKLANRTTNLQRERSKQRRRGGVKVRDHASP